MQPIEPTNPFNQSNDISRLVLGTAQLGMAYGVSNVTGQPDLKTADAIVKTAWENGIRKYDTAQAYGKSEEVLGKTIRSLDLSDRTKIITKLHPDLDHLNKSELEESVEKSLSRLNVPILHGLMLHREEYLEIWESGLGETLQSFVRKGLAEHIGVSVYFPDRAVSALKKHGINMIEIPSNIFDRRFEQAGVFELAQERGKEIYVRSVFLQGLILMDIEDLPERMQFGVQVLKRLESLSKETGLSKQDLSLNYVGETFPETNVVFGAETPEQVKKNVKTWESPLPADVLLRLRQDFAEVPEEMIDPRRW